MSSEYVVKTAEYVEKKMSGESTGHDWWHVYRVWQIAKHIAKNEPNVDMTIVELGALLHDIADWKFADGDLEAGPKAARNWLSSINADESTIEQVEEILRSISFKGAKVKVSLKSIEAKIIFDADKLDAIGAIGIARAFAYGGHKGSEIYNPRIKPTLHESFEEYKNNQSHTINHFYEKLLLLKDLMQTKTGKQLAAKRHDYMEKYLEEFYAEWDGVT